MISHHLNSFWWVKTTLYKNNSQYIRNIFVRFRGYFRKIYNLVFLWGQLFFPEFSQDYIFQGTRPAEGKNEASLFYIHALRTTFDGPGLTPFGICYLSRLFCSENVFDPLYPPNNFLIIMKPFKISYYKIVTMLTWYLKSSVFSLI